MVKCREMSELVTADFERALPFRRWMEVRCHLALCRSCRRYFAQMRATMGLLPRLPRHPPAPELEAALLAHLPQDGGDAPG